MSGRIHINNQEEAIADVGNSYLHVLNIEKIYTTTVPKKYNPADILTVSIIPYDNYPLMKWFLVNSVSDLRGVS